MTTAYGGTDAPLDTAVATSGRSPYTAATASWGNRRTTPSPGQPKLRFKDTCKSALKCDHVLDQWLSTVNNRAEWERLTRVVCYAYNSKRVQDYEKKKGST